jgi:hypothetical protein
MTKNFVSIVVFAIAMFLPIRIFSYFNEEQWSHYKDVVFDGKQVNQELLYKVSIDEEILKRSNTLKDVRLITSDKRELPFLLRDKIIYFSCTATSPLRLFYGNDSAELFKYDIAFQKSDFSKAVEAHLNSEQVNTYFIPAGYRKAERKPFLLWIIVIFIGVTFAIMIFKVMRQIHKDDFPVEKV